MSEGVSSRVPPRRRACRDDPSTRFRRPEIPQTDREFPSSLATAEDAKAKAAKAAKMVKKGVKGKLLKKRFSPVFHR